MTTTVSDKITSCLRELGTPGQAAHLMRFFKTSPGEYGYGDHFLGVRVPETRQVIREFERIATMDDALDMVHSPWHEVRLAGFLIMVKLYRKALKNDAASAQRIVDTYLSVLEYGNNWDLVDMVGPKILGEHLLRHPEQTGVLFQLAARHDSLWHQRVAMVSTWTLIRGGRFDEAVALAAGFLDHKHDLMHKASGWMLREIGKRGGMDILLDFLDEHAARMPRTMLRYAIEKLAPATRAYYMGLKDSNRSVSKQSGR